MSGAPVGVTISPDGKSVYVTSIFSNSVARFNRNTTTGALTQPAGTAGCVSDDGSGPCANGHGLVAANAAAVSPNGKSLYVASDSVARFNRNTTTGAITQPAGTAGCVSDDGTGPCADGHGIGYPHGVVLSPNGKSVYVSSYFGDGVLRFNRNTTTGAITQPAGPAGCISETGAGSCADGHALDGVDGIALSPDAKSLYVASFDSSAVAIINRNTTTGAIIQPAGAAGCVSNTGAGPCADGHGLFDPYSVAVSPNGKSVYAGSGGGDDAVVRFNRAP
jgi:DNA-binding beta-propeller fold protein YncE